MDETRRRDLVRRAARVYLDRGYLIARDEPRGIALVRPNPFNPIWFLLLGPIALIFLQIDRERWVFLTVTSNGRLVVRYG
jgi:hypothetical protein